MKPTPVLLALAPAADLGEGGERLHQGRLGRVEVAGEPVGETGAPQRRRLASCTIWPMEWSGSD